MRLAVLLALSILANCAPAPATISPVVEYQTEAVARLADNDAQLFAALRENLAATLEAHRHLLAGEIEADIALSGYTIGNEIDFAKFESDIEDPALENILLRMVRDGAWTREEARPWLTDYAASSGLSPESRILVRDTLLKRLTSIQEFDSGSAAVLAAVDEWNKHTFKLWGEAVANNKALAEFATARYEMQEVITRTADDFWNSNILPNVPANSRPQAKRLLDTLLGRK